MIVTILAFILILTILVTVHELGHLFVAKALGVQVKTFSIGFGPKIKRIYRDSKGTDYLFCLIPLGGYVELAEPPEDQTLLSEKEFNKESEYIDERPPTHKILVCLAGPLANLIFAVIVFVPVYMTGVLLPVYMEKPAKLGWINPDSPGAASGLRVGDIIISVNGKETKTWSDFAEHISLTPANLNVVVNRQDHLRSFVIKDISQLNNGLHPNEKITVGDVIAKSPADIGGIKAGDVILEMNNVPLVSWNQLLEKVKESNPIVFLIEHDGRRKTVSLYPRLDPISKKGFAGISYKPEEFIKKCSLFPAIAQAVEKTVDVITQSLSTIWGLLTGHIGLKLLGGPIAIAQASGNTARAGLIPFLILLSFLSIQIGIFNLLPFIPILDGGQITISCIEIIRRKKMRSVSVEWACRVGWALMGVLMLFVTWNDIYRLYQ